VDVRLPFILIVAELNDRNPREQDRRMRLKKRPAPKRTILSGRNSKLPLRAQYAELIRLRKVVDQAELSAGASRGLRHH